MADKQGTPQVGKSVKFGIGAAAGGVATKQIEVLWPIDFGKRGRLVESNGLRGTRERFSTGVNEGTYDVGGRIATDVRPDTLDLLLPFMLGATEAADEFLFAETLPEAAIQVCYGAQMFTSANCKANTWTLSGNSGEDLRLEIDWEGKTLTVGLASAFPDLAATLSVEQPYIFHQGVLTLGSDTWPFRSFRLVGDNRLILDRYMNTQYRSALPEADLIATLQTENPFTAEEYATIYDVNITGLSCVLTFTNGTNVLTATLANIKKAITPPTVGGRDQEIMLPCNWTAYNQLSVPCIKFNNVWTAGSGV